MQTFKVVDAELKIGDIVKVIDSGKQYSLYAEMAQIMNAKFWKKNNNTTEGEVGRIIEMASHEDRPETIICLVRRMDKDYEFLIGEKGLEKASGVDVQKYYNRRRKQYGDQS